VDDPLRLLISILALLAGFAGLDEAFAQSAYTPTGFEVRAGQVTLGVWEPERMGLPFEPNHNGISLRVPDVAEARATLERDGVQFTGETIDTGVCHMAFLHDPDGNTIMLHRRYAPV